MYEWNLNNGEEFVCKEWNLNMFLRFVYIYIYYIWDLVDIFFWRWGLNLEEKNKIIILYNSLKKYLY